MDVRNYIRKPVEAVVTQWNGIDDYPDIYYGRPTENEDGEVSWDAVSCARPAPGKGRLVILQEGDNPFKRVSGRNYTPVVAIWGEGYYPLTVGRYIVEEDGKVVAVLSKAELDKRYTPK